jgi:hypothetical protein
MERTMNLPEKGGTRVDLGTILFLLFWSLTAACRPVQTPAPTPVPAGTPTATATRFVFPPTFTPMPTGEPTRTGTPGPSRTPVPTVTLGPTLEPSPTPLVEILTASGADQPFAAARLLFVDDGRALVWDPASGEIFSAGELPQNLEQISLSAGGSYIAGAYQVEGRMVVIVFNRVTGEPVRTIELESDDLFDLALSPNGLHLALITVDEIPLEEPTATPEPSGTPTATPEPQDTPTVTPTATPTESAGLQVDRQIYLVDLSGGGPPETVAGCEDLCTGVVWSPLSDFVAWGQADGLWGASTASPDAPERLLEPFVAGVSGGVQTTGSYLPLEFSPSGRYILIRKGILSGSVLAVVDRTTGRSENLPGSGAYTGDGTGLTWLTGDALFIARPGIAGLDILPAGEIWGLSPGDPESLFVRLAEFPLPGDTGARPSAPIELPDGRIGLSLVNLRDGNDSQVNGLYLLDPATGELERVNYLPLVLVDELIWLPDLSGALVVSRSRLLYVPSGFGPVYSMRLLLGTGACCFRWIP